MIKKIFVILLLISFYSSSMAESGYRLWLRYDLIKNDQLLKQYKKKIAAVNFQGTSATLAAAKEELAMGLQGLVGIKIPTVNSIINNTVVAGTPVSSMIIAALPIKQELEKAGKEG